jgi:regulatory protein
MDQPDYKTCLNTALRILGRRDHSSRELERKLRQRGYQRGDIQTVLAECRRFNYLDDRKYAFSQIHYLRAKGYGAHRIRQTLKTKGLSSDLITEAIEAICNEVDQIRDCRRALAKKRRQSGMEGLVSAEDKKRLYRFLYQRGYPPAIIQQAMDEQSGEV